MHRPHLACHQTFGLPQESCGKCCYEQRVQTWTFLQAAPLGHQVFQAYLSIYQNCHTGLRASWNTLVVLTSRLRSVTLPLNNDNKKKAIPAVGCKNVRSRQRLSIGASPETNVSQHPVTRTALRKSACRRHLGWHIEASACGSITLSLGVCAKRNIMAWESLWNKGTHIVVPMEQRYPPVVPMGQGGEVTGGGGREGKKKGGEGHQRNGLETKYIFKGQVNTHIYACTHMCGISYIIWLLYSPFVIIYI